MSLTIRPLAPQDKDRWQVLWQGYLDFYGVGDLDPAVTARNWDVIVAGKGPFYGLAATDETGALRGFAHYLLHPITWGLGLACYLEDLYVDETARGTGAGTGLIEALIGLGQKNGWDRLYWNTQAGNRTARRLYDRYTSANDFVQYKLPLNG